MLVAAAFWRPDGPRGSVEEVLSQPHLAHYVAGWPQLGDLGVVALDGQQPVGAAWVRPLPESDPGYGFVDAVTPELSMGVAQAWRGRGVGSRLLDALVAAADAGAGEAVFKKCAACHTINQGGANGIGPNLYGTLGEPIGQGKGGFAFSDALKGVGGNWDWEKMNAWLTSPRKFANGTKMTFAGLSNPEDRANVIAYLNQQGSNLPLPAAPAPGTDPGAKDAAVAVNPASSQPRRPPPRATERSPSQPNPMLANPAASAPATLHATSNG